MKEYLKENEDVKNHFLIGNIYILIHNNTVEDYNNNVLEKTHLFFLKDRSLTTCSSKLSNKISKHSSIWGSPYRPTAIFLKLIKRNCKSVDFNIPNYEIENTGTHQRTGSFNGSY